MTTELETAALEQSIQNWAKDYAGQDLAIFGAGPVGAAIMRRLREFGANVVAVVDDYSPPESVLDDMPVTASRTLTALRPDAVVLATTRSRARMHQRLDMIGFSGQVLKLPGEDDDMFATGPQTRVSQIEQFHNRHAGQRAFLIGNGPSLLSTDPRRITNAVTFGCNAIFLMEHFKPDYYCVEDVLVGEDRGDQIDQLPWTKFFPKDLRRWLTDGYFFNGVRLPEIDQFSTDCAEAVYVNITVLYPMLQLAFYMGCDPVYLVGVDHSYSRTASGSGGQDSIMVSTTKDSDHFHPDYMGQGARGYVPRLDRMEQAYRLAKTTYEAHGRKVLNATKGGKLEIFDRVDFEQVVNG